MKRQTVLGKTSFIFLILFCSTTLLFSQQSSVKGYCVLDSSTIVEKWKALMKTYPGWKALQARLNSSGFKQIVRSPTMAGFTVEGNEFFAYDFFNKGGQGASLIYRKNKGEVYMAYVIMKKGEKDFGEALEGGEEYYAEKNGSIKQANSWRRCFRRCSRGECSKWCLSFVSGCAAAAGALIAAGVGMTTPVAIAVFAGCTFFGCGSCFISCALGCD